MRLALGPVMTPTPGMYWPVCGCDGCITGAGAAGCCCFALNESMICRAWSGGVLAASERGIPSSPSFAFNSLSGMLVLVPAYDGPGVTWGAAWGVPPIALPGCPPNIASFVDWKILTAWL